MDQPHIKKYPRTRHVEGSRRQIGDTPDDKKIAELRDSDLVVEEKVDGANSGISFNASGDLFLQSRGHFLTGGGRERHFSLFKTWANVHAPRFRDVIGSRFIIYGEWLYAKHTVFYDALPAYFMEFDVFDRETGQPVWPIEERPVQASDLEGEKAWPTQPFPTKPPPLMRQKYTEADASNISPQTHQLTLDRIKASPNFGPFPAPSLNETIMFPGYDGGMEWGGGAADPDGIYYVNINEMPWLLQMIETRKSDGSKLVRGERDYLIFCGACHGLDRKGNLQAGFPPLLGIGDRKTRAEIELITRQGGGRMPGYAVMPDGKRKAILDYVLNYKAPSASRPEPGAVVDKQPPAYAFGGFRRWLDDEGYPAIKPPWGTLNAVDLNTGEIKWKVILGEYPELTARGIPPTGTENYGGPLVTASGLIFIGATADETFRVFDKENGNTLFQAKLPFSGNATPSTYVVNGRQYVVISAGGGKSGRTKGGSLVAFALPAEQKN